MWELSTLPHSLSILGSFFFRLNERQIKIGKLSSVQINCLWACSLLLFLLQNCNQFKENVKTETSQTIRTCNTYPYFFGPAALLIFYCLPLFLSLCATSHHCYTFMELSVSDNLASMTRQRRLPDLTDDIQVLS